ncbi:MAG: hypothetical protein WC558_17015 [Patulibacter sp.]
MTARSRRLAPALSGLLVTAVAATAFATPSRAAEAVAPNACKYMIDGYWRSLDIRMAGTAAPVYVPPGAGFKLQGMAVAAAFPDWIAEYGYNLGLLSAGPNRVPAEVWIAVAGRGSAQGTQVLKAAVTAETAITARDGQQFGGATPLAVTVPLPESVWTAPTDEGGRVTFEQAPPGTLPPIPGRNGGAAYQPTGSIFIRAALSNSTVFDLDCQPGRGSTDGNSFSTQAAPPFELAYVDPNAEATGVEAPVVVSPRTTLNAKSLKTNGQRTSVAVKLRNPGLIAADGQVRIATAGKERTTAKGKARALTLTSWKTYRVASGKTGTVRLQLSKNARALLKLKKSVKVKLSLRAATGRRNSADKPIYGKAATTTVTLKR